MAIETLRPSAAGDECNIALEIGAACPNHYQNVDEAEHDSATTVVWGQTANSVWKRDLYNIDDSGVGAGTINFIKVYTYLTGHSSSDQDSAKLAIKSGDVVAEGSGYMPGLGYTLYSHTWSENPDGDAAWTWEDIDALQVGISLRQGKNDAHSDYYQSKCTQIYVEVDYTAVTEKTSSDSGSGSDARLSGNPLALMSKADSGSGAEGTPASEATLTGSETGSGIEALFSLGGKLVTDAGSGSENSYLDIITSAKSSSDAGSGAEASGLLAAFEQGETGSGNESLLSRVLSQPDSGGGSDATSALLAALINTETGFGIDSVLSRLMITSETGSGVEKLLKREVILFDSGSGIEAATMYKILLAADSGAGLEALASLLALITAEEAGYGLERLGARVMTATGVSSMKLLHKKGKARIPSKQVNL